MKAYRDADGNVRLFRPDLNIRRLNRSMERLRFPQVDEASMIELIRQGSVNLFFRWQTRGLLLALSVRWAERGAALALKDSSANPSPNVSSLGLLALFLV